MWIFVFEVVELNVELVLERPVRDVEALMHATVFTPHHLILDLVKLQVVDPVPDVLGPSEGYDDTVGIGVIARHHLSLFLLIIDYFKVI